MCLDAEDIGKYAEAILAWAVATKHELLAVPLELAGSAS